VLLASFAVRTWDASFGLYAGRHFDERFTFKNVSAILKHGEFKPRHAFYLSLSYLPQTAVLAASDGKPEHIVRMTWYVTSKREYLASYKSIGKVYRELIGRHYPAMTAVEVAALVEDEAKVEIEATAVIPD